jgi:FAD/FMN-containing dehydrogenase
MTIERSMSKTSDIAVTDFRGRVLTADDHDYDDARRVWNGMIDRRPLLIVRAADVEDVSVTVRLAVQHRLPLAVRGGGHNVAGSSVCDGGIVLDLAGLRAARVDSKRAIVRAGGGLTWAQLDRATQRYGLATNGGMVSSTGIGGLTLGGGVGWLMRQHGLTIDNLLAAEMITATGERVTTNAIENPDLFWALRGGGGNFGVVTEFVYRLHEIDTVLGGFVMYEIARAATILRRYDEFCRAAPNNVTTLVVLTTAPTLPFVPEPLQGTPVLFIAVCATGADAEEVVRPLRALGPPVADLIRPMPYTGLQSMQDPTAPPGARNYWKSGYADELSDPLIERLVAHAAVVTSPMTQIHVHQMGGAVAQQDRSATAFAHRDLSYLINIVGMWQDPAEDDLHLAWVAGLWRDIEDVVAAAAYSNFFSHDDVSRSRAAFSPAIWDQLGSIKARWDPTQVFDPINPHPFENDLMPAKYEVG